MNIQWSVLSEVVLGSCINGDTLFTFTMELLKKKKKKNSQLKLHLIDHLLICHLAQQMKCVTEPKMKTIISFAFSR